MTLTLLAVLPLLLAQEKASNAPSPFDRIIELEITAEGEPAIEGHGPTAIAEYESEFEGTLHIWTESELDLFLRVDDAAEARPLASDDDSGGGTTPYIAQSVQPGDWLVVLVAGDPGTMGPVTLHLIAAPETAATRAAVSHLGDVRTAVERLADDGDLAAARDLASEALQELSAAQMNHPGLLSARNNLANTLDAIGDLVGAHALDESFDLGLDELAVR